jgi:type II secretion system protein G
MQNRTRRGFTLIEILIVVVILGILAALVVPNIAASGQEAAMSSARSQLVAVRGQIEMYRLRSGGVLPGVGGADGTDELWEALTTPLEGQQPLLPRTPVLPMGYTWNWDGSTLTVSYEGDYTAASEGAPDW